MIRAVPQSGRGTDAIAVETRDLCRVLGGAAATPRTILDGVTLSVRRGQFVALTGASGSGKSTLLYLLGALDRPTSGEVWLDGIDLSALDDDDRAGLRNERLGFVFQFHFLLPEFTVLENVIVPVLRRGVLSASQARDRGYAALEELGLGDLCARRPGQLSGGQQQRVWIARAIANDPAVILADEPTGNLDSASAGLVFDVFARLAREQGRTIVMVTHASDLAARTDRQITLKDGRVVADVERLPRG
jgi:lipoprotein-releasing system ATP-binding protein